MFKWLCLLVAVIALSAFGWILNDVRLEIKGLAERLDRQLPPLLTETQRVALQLDRHLPKLMAQSEQAAGTINTQMPKLLMQTEQAAETVNRSLPRLLTSTELALDNVSELSDSFKQYKGLLGVVHAASQNKDLFSYGTSLLSWIGGQNATIGTKKSGSESELKQATPASQWAEAARKDAHFLSMAATSKSDLLHGLARTNLTSPLHIQIGTSAPRLLADWVKETHPDSKDVK
jgi:hypothetical protein